MPNTVYANKVLESKLEDQLTTKLDLSQFMVVDTSLTQEPGMVKTINVYTGTGSAEDLDMGEGNSAECTIAFTPANYTVGVTQAKGSYYDEEAMKDPFAVDSLVKYLGEAMINHFTAKAIDEMSGATQIRYECDWNFAQIVDAISMLGPEGATGGYMLVNKAQVAALRTELSMQLQYVEAFARSGYIGSICGFAVYESNAVPAGEAYIGFPEAITCFVKKGVEFEQERDADTRSNTVYARKVAVVALTDATKIVKLTEDEEPESSESSEI